MKHVQSECMAIRDTLGSLSDKVSDSAVELMLSHLDWLLEKNKVLNLTALREREPAFRLHVLDSLLALPEVIGAPEGTLVDIGTGGGFPGVPLVLASGRTGVLVDSVAKKAAAVQEWVSDSSLGDFVEVVAMRSEDLAKQRGSLATVVVARAVAPLPTLVELASPLLTSGGRLVALKAAISPDELRSGLRAAERCGMVHRGTRSVSVPQSGEARTILVFERSGAAKVRLPRRNGMAQKHPLG